MPDESKDDVSKDGLLAVTARDDKGRPTLGGIALTKKLGQGGMGAVYQGDHPRLGVTVAVKVLPFHLVSGNPSAVDYFMREAKVAAQLNHPNLVRIFDVNFDKDPRTGTDVYYLIMEFVPGATAGGLMRDHVRSGKGPLPETDALDIVIAATSGLIAAHELNIVHRDIKPDNIIVPITAKGDAQLKKSKLMDLGLAKNTDDSASIGLTAANVAMGTPGYMSPEQAESAKTAGPPADVFSMGATLYALLTGSAPFSGTTVLNVLRKTAEEPHPPIRTVNPNVTAGTALVIDKCLAKNVEFRIQTAQQLHDALVTARSGLKGDLPTEKTLVAIQTFAPMEILAEKTVVRTPAPGPPTSPTVPSPVPAAATTPAPAAPPAKKSRVLVLALVGCLGLPLLAAGAVGIWWVTRPKADSPSALMDRAAAAEKRGDWKDAVALYEQAQKAQPSNLLAAKIEELKDKTAKQERYDAAIKAGQEALDRKNWMEAEKRFTDAQKIIDGPEAKAGLEAAHKGTGSAYGAMIERAKAAVARRDWSAAELAYQEALKAQADSLVAKDGIADVGKRRDAERRAAAKAGESRAEKDPERAWSLAHEAVELDPDLYAVQMSAVEAALGSKRPEWYEEAMGHAEKAEALASTPEDRKKAADAKAELGREKEKSGKFLAVMKELNAAIDEDDWEKAQRILEDAKKNHPNRPALAERERKIASGLMWFKEWKAGDEAEKKGDLAAAQSAYEKAEAVASRPRSKMGVERVKEARDKGFKDALARARECMEKRDAAGFARAIEDAKKLRPGSAEIAELEKKFSSGPLSELAKSGIGPVDQLVFSRDRDRVVGTGSASDAVMAWDAATLTGSPRGNRVGENQPRPLNPVALGGSMVAFLIGVPAPLQDRYDIAVVDVTKNQVRRIESEIMGTKVAFKATALGITPDGSALVRVTRDSHKDNGLDVVSIDVINPEDGSQVRSIGSFKGQAHAFIRSSAATGQIVTGGGYVRRWKVEGRDTWTPEEQTAGTTLYFWSYPDPGQILVELGVDGGAITAFDFSPDGKRLVAGSEGGKITIVNPENHEIVGRIPVGGAVTAVAVSDQGLAAVAAGGKLVLIDLDEVRKIEGIQVAGTIRSVLLTPDAQTLYLGEASEGRVRKYGVGRLK